MTTTGYMVQSKSRDAVVACADRSGWRHESANGYSDEFVRDIILDPTTALGKFVANMDWQARERVVVDYSSSGAVLQTWHGTPAHQSALGGQFVDGRFMRGGRKTAIAILESDPWTPPTHHLEGAK